MKRILFTRSKKILTTFIIGTTLLTSVPTTALASSGDIWKGSTKIGSIAQLILHPSAFLDLISHMSNYSYEVNGKGYDVAKVNDIFNKNPKASLSDVHGMIESQLTGTPLSSSNNLVGTFSIFLDIPYCTVTLPDKTQTVTNLTVDGVTKSDGTDYSVSNGVVNITKVTANNVITITTSDGKTYTVTSDSNTTNPSVTITSIADITKTINQGDSYTLPTTVEATMSDGSKKQVAVTWNNSSQNSANMVSNLKSDDNDLQSSIVEMQKKIKPSDSDSNTNNLESQIVTQLGSSKPQAVSNSLVVSSSITVDTSKAGTYTFYGIVDGYDKQVKLTLVINATSTATMTDLQFQSYLNSNFGSLTIDGLTVNFNWKVNPFTLSGTDEVVLTTLNSSQYVNWLKWCLNNRTSTIKSFLANVNTKISANYPNKEFFGGVQYQDYWNSYPSSFPSSEISYDYTRNQWLVTHTCADIYSFDGITTGVIVK